MQDEVIKRVIKDDFGKEHTYEVTRHAGREGRKLAQLVIPMVAGGLTLDSDGELGIALGPALKHIVGILDDDVSLELLKHSRRDGRLITPTVFDEIYSGNYGEFVFAMAEIIKINYAGGIRRMIEGKDELLAGF